MKTNNKIKLSIVLALIISLLLSVCVSGVSATQEPTSCNTDAYDFPIKTGTEEWKELRTIQDKIAACQIPESRLLTMSTDALIATIKNYPLAVNLFAYDTLEMGYEKVKSQFNGFVELEKRYLQDPQKTLDLLNNASTVVLKKDPSPEFTGLFLKSIEKCLISKTHFVESQIRWTSTYVYTPNNTAVPAIKNRTWADTGYTQAQGQAIDNQFLSTYSSATKLRSANPSYNCHSYAWHSTAATNPYWINDPSSYILDGSYSLSTYYAVGEKILYGTPGNSPEHSAIVAAVADSHHLTYVKSKWGIFGLFKHLYYDCPYTSSIHPYH